MPTYIVVLYVGLETILSGYYSDEWMDECTHNRLGHSMYFFIWKTNTEKSRAERTIQKRKKKEKKHQTKNKKNKITLKYKITLNRIFGGKMKEEQE